jgi:FAD binding domain
MSTIDIQAFRAVFHGPVFERTDEGYDEARQIWNASVSKHPRVIARCCGLADVMAAVNFGRTNNLPTAIRGGGHNVGGRALCDDGLVMDLSRMRSVFVDHATRRVRVQGGGTLADIANLIRRQHTYCSNKPIALGRAEQAQVNKYRVALSDSAPSTKPVQKTPATRWPEKREHSAILTRNLVSYFKVISRVRILVINRPFCVRLSITCCSLLLSPYCCIRRSRTFCAKPSRAAKFL